MWLSTDQSVPFFHRTIKWAFSVQICDCCARNAQKRCAPLTGWRLVIRRALRYMSHVGCGGEHPPNFTVLGMTECEGHRRRRAWEGGRGAAAALVQRRVDGPTLVAWDKQCGRFLAECQCVHPEVPTGTRAKPRSRCHTPPRSALRRKYPSANPLPLRWSIPVHLQRHSSAGGFGPVPALICLVPFRGCAEAGGVDGVSLGYRITHRPGPSRRLMRSCGLAVIALGDRR